MIEELKALLENLREVRTTANTAIAKLTAITEGGVDTGFAVPQLLIIQKSQVEGMVAGITLAMKGIQELLDRHDNTGG